MPELAHKKEVDMNGLRYSTDDPYSRLGPAHTCLYVPGRSPGMGEGGDS